MKTVLTFFSSPKSIRNLISDLDYVTTEVTGLNLPSIIVSIGSLVASKELNTYVAVALSSIEDVSAHQTS